MSKKESSWEMLLRLHGDTKIDFDTYRDASKGCGPHCKGWDNRKDSFCENHTQAILKGDYLVKGGEVEKMIKELLDGKKS